MDFKLVSDFKPTGDQPQAIEKLVEGIKRGEKMQTLLGVTGSGKTFTMANIIEKVNRPTLVLAHNKTLAAQLCSEFREFFPENAVEYFVSYYDYYQPEAYIPGKDVYIEKDALVNDEIDKLRHSATSSLFERRDVIIVASVSCIFSLGDPAEYNSLQISLRPGMAMSREDLISHLISISYERNDINFVRDKFRVRGDTVEILPAKSGERAIRVEFFGDEIDRLSEVNVLTGELLKELSYAVIFPATHYAVSDEKREAALSEIEREMIERKEYFESCNKLIEAQRIEQRTRYDLEMLREIGFCSGVENYSRVLEGRAPGSTPHTLLDYFPKDFLLFVDESHMTLPQVRGMGGGDRASIAGQVDLELVDPETFGERGFPSPAALLSWLEENRPECEPVLTHGDFCLPNIMLDGWKFSKYIDVGNGGIGDRHVDLFWGAWTLNFNLGTNEYRDVFFDAYGRDKIDPAIIELIETIERFG